MESNSNKVQKPSSKYHIANNEITITLIIKYYKISMLYKPCMGNILASSSRNASTIVGLSLVNRSICLSKADDCREKSKQLVIFKHQFNQAMVKRYNGTIP